MELGRDSDTGGQVVYVTQTPFFFLLNAKIKEREKKKSLKWVGCKIFLLQILEYIFVAIFR